jgi:hypothetical protein
LYHFKKKKKKLIAIVLICFASWAQLTSQWNLNTNKNIACIIVHLKVWHCSVIYGWKRSNITRVLRGTFDCKRQVCFVFLSLLRKVNMDLCQWGFIERSRIYKYELGFCFRVSSVTECFPFSFSFTKRQGLFVVSLFSKTIL